MNNNYIELNRTKVTKPSMRYISKNYNFLLEGTYNFPIFSSSFVRWQYCLLFQREVIYPIFPIVIDIRFSIRRNIQMPKKIIAYTYGPKRMCIPEEIPNINYD